jgi:hypothetical protein
VYAYGGPKLAVAAGVTSSAFAGVHCAAANAAAPNNMPRRESSPPRPFTLGVLVLVRIVFIGYLLQLRVHRTPQIPEVHPRHPTKELSDPSAERLISRVDLSFFKLGLSRCFPSASKYIPNCLLFVSVGRMEKYIFSATAPDGGKLQSYLSLTAAT